MGVVAGPEDPVGADGVDHGAEVWFRRLAADPALAAEVLARQLVDLTDLALDALEELDVLVEAIQPIGEPGAPGFEDRDAQCWVSLEDPADRE